MDLNLEVTEKQMSFIEATADEVLFGGAAGGGKSYAQLIDALLFGLTYQGSKQLILRRTFPELRRSLIMVSLTIYPQGICTYNDSNKRWTIAGGSSIEFGYCDSENDVTQYQSAEYDVVRFDELTHFTEFMYQYLISRVRGANGFPKQMKSSTNPGGVGHGWVKGRFINDHKPFEIWTDEFGRTRVFIPARVQENHFLMDADPKYIQRLEQLPEMQRRTLLDGDWDVYEGQFFTEFRDDRTAYVTRRWTHIIEPFMIPPTWKRYMSFDWGYSKPFCVHWWAVDEDDVAYCYREWYGWNGQPDTGLRITGEQVAIGIRKIEKELEIPGQFFMRIADPAIWGTQTGESIFETMARRSVVFTPGDNKRITGWMQVRERMKFDHEGRARMYIFNTCKQTIRTLPMQIHDAHKPEDMDTKGEDHACDSIRYFCMARPVKTILDIINEDAAFNPLMREEKNRHYGRGFMTNNR